MRLYRVKDWAIYYENNRTRDLKDMGWVPVRNGHDGDGYTALVCREEGPAMLGAWLAILQVASKCGHPAGRCGEGAIPRGTLIRDNGKPHDSASIARVCHFPEPVIKKALELLCSDDIQWLECVEMPMKTQIPQEGAGLPQEGAPKPQATDYGTEGNGIERKGMEVPPPTPAIAGRENLNGVDPLPPPAVGKGEIQLRVEKLFNRRETTAMTSKETAAFKTARKLLETTPEPDWAAVEAYHGASVPTIKRRDLLTLLNNWNTEVDRANAFVVGGCKSDVCNGNGNGNHQAQNRGLVPNYEKDKW